MRFVVVAAAALVSAAVLAAIDGRLDAAPPRASSPVGQSVAGDRAGAASRIRERARARRPAATVDGWRSGPRGFATYYADLLDGRETASGTVFDNDELVAAHPRYPFGTKVRVTNLRNGRSVVVTIVDRGPVRSARANGVIIDLSRAAARRLDFIEEGRTRVRLEIRDPENDAANER